MEDKNYIYHLIALEFSNEMDSAQQHELQSWLKLSSENVAEYNEIIKVLTYYDALDAMKKIDVSHDLLLVKKKLNKHSNKNSIRDEFSESGSYSSITTSHLHQPGISQNLQRFLKRLA